MRYSSGGGGDSLHLDKWPEKRLRPNTACMRAVSSFMLIHLIPLLRCVVGTAKKGLAIPLCEIVLHSCCHFFDSASSIFRKFSLRTPTEHNNIGETPTEEEAGMERLLRHELVCRVVLSGHHVHVNRRHKLGQQLVQQLDSLSGSSALILGQVPKEEEGCQSMEMDELSGFILTLPAIAVCACLQWSPRQGNFRPRPRARSGR